jgi:hypothetical protein
MGDLVFVNKALVAVGRLPSDLRDKFGETTSSPKNGFQAGAAYKDASGIEVDTMILVYRVTLSEQLK